jgi:hypothetical protein
VKNCEIGKSMTTTHVRKISPCEVGGGKISYFLEN